METFQIYIDKRIYFPGERVSGSIQFMTSEDVECDGMDIELFGKGYSEVGSRKPPLRYTYAFGRVTALSRAVETTPVLGVNGKFSFGHFWNKNQGNFCLEVPTHPSCQPPQLMARIMRSDHAEGWYADVVLDVNAHLNCGDQMLNINSAEFPSGSICFSISWKGMGDGCTVDYNFAINRSPTFVIFLQIKDISGLHLPQGTEVYVQCFWLQTKENVDSHTMVDSCHVGLAESSSLPVIAPSGNRLDERRNQLPHMMHPIDCGLIQRQVVLPPGIYTIRFNIDLPDDLPSTIVAENGSIVYYLLASVRNVFPRRNVSHTWQRLEFFTIQQPHVVASMTAPSSKCASFIAYPRIKLGCINFGKIPWSQPLGQFTLSIKSTRFCYAAGETIGVTIELENDKLARIESATYYLVRICTLQGTDKRTVFQASDTFTRKPTGSVQDHLFLDLVAPNVAPTYCGGLAIDPIAINELDLFQSEIDIMCRNGHFHGRALDPITWSYEFVVNVVCRVDGCKHRSTISCPIIVGTIGLDLLPVPQLRMVAENPDVALSLSGAVARDDLSGMSGTTLGLDSANGKMLHTQNECAIFPWKRVEGVKEALSRIDLCCIPMKHVSNVNSIVLDDIASLKSTMYMPWYYRLKLPDAPLSESSWSDFAANIVGRPGEPGTGTNILNFDF